MHELISLLKNSVKDSKFLSFLSDEFIENKINKYFLREGKKRKDLEKAYEKVGESKISKNKIFKEIVKEIKSELNHQYSVFLTKDFSKKEKAKTSGEVLVLHKSSHERLDFYEQIYQRIFKWYKPKKIGDLACGMNPISYEIISKTLEYKPTYFATDLAEKDMEFLNEFFENENVLGIAKAYDLTEERFLEEKELQDCDLIFLFKALDSIEEVKRHYSKILLEKLTCKRVVVSFPTRSIGSRISFDMKKRSWFFKYLEKQNWKYDTFEIENEIFFLIEKN